MSKSLSASLHIYIALRYNVQTWHGEEEEDEQNEEKNGYIKSTMILPLRYAVVFFSFIFFFVNYYHPSVYLQHLKYDEISSSIPFAKQTAYWLHSHRDTLSSSPHTLSLSLYLFPSCPVLFPFRCNIVVLHHFVIRSVITLICNISTRQGLQ